MVLKTEHTGAESAFRLRDQIEKKNNNNKNWRLKLKNKK
jgi:hypothetical protein